MRAAAEKFLRTAKVVGRQEIPVGVTDPQKLTLDDAERGAEAVLFPDPRAP